MKRYAIFVTSLSLLTAACSQQSESAQISAGISIYDENCAACHGPAGDVRKAENYDADTPDLRSIAARSAGGRMPTVMLAEIIDGRRIVQAHGRTMPVWGEELSGSDGDGAREKIDALLAYIESIQTE